ncbi:protein NipSnap homolog 3A [Periophthalmus magnuspinnatus]|uniref:protein NipSnap homolog 3A n=1 Tax=Periophthalmus magnuspinnatus TaxID=409849 RepID=UPI00145BB8C4|nr:protein NipSnap homolog 3A [Periophthalmus magnuspinnatus]
MMQWSRLGRVLLQNQVQIRSGFCSSAPPLDRALYEFRVYDVQPHLYTRFLQLTNQKIHLRTAHSQLIGYWSVEYGALNQFFHIWRYESYSQRAAVRSSLAQDPDWLEQYISKAIPMLTKQTNEVARLLPWQPMKDPPTEGGVFELQRFHIKPKGWGLCEQGLKNFIQSQHAPGLGQVIGAFSNDIGENNTVQVLWWFQSPDHWAETRDQRETAQSIEEHLDSVSNKLLFPLPFSPMK